MFEIIFKSVCILIFAAAWLALCVAKYNKWHRRRKNCTKELQVKVVEVLERRTARSGMVYKPVFKPVNDEDRSVIDSAFYSKFVSFEVGETVELLVNPDNVKEFLYKDDSLNKGRTADILCCFIPVILVAAYVLTRSFRFFP